MKYLYELPEYAQGQVAYIGWEALSSWFEVGDVAGLDTESLSVLYQEHAARFLGDWLMRHGGISSEREYGLCVRAYRPFDEPQLHGDRLIIAWARWGNSWRSVYLIGVAPCRFGIALTIEVAEPRERLNAFDAQRLRGAANHLHDVFQWRRLPLHVLGESGQVTVRRKACRDQVA